jgi:hypothetical protein
MYKELGKADGASILAACCFTILRFELQVGLFDPPPPTSCPTFEIFYRCAVSVKLLKRVELANPGMAVVREAH